MVRFESPIQRCVTCYYWRWAQISYIGFPMSFDIRYKTVKTTSLQIYNLLLIFSTPFMNKIIVFFNNKQCSVCCKTLQIWYTLQTGKNNLIPNLQRVTNFFTLVINKLHCFLKINNVPYVAKRCKFDTRYKTVRTT